MTNHTETPLSFHCGVCSKPLTDARALFTSCGHFFCADSPSCTRLQTGPSAGRCEQCAKPCDTGTLLNKAERYDQRVQSFIFMDLPSQLNTLAEIIEFRQKHLQILTDNTLSLTSQLDTLKKQNTSLTSQLSSTRSELQTLQSINASLRNQISTLRAQLSNHPPARPASPPSVELVEPHARTQPSRRLNRNPGLTPSLRPRQNPITATNIPSTTPRSTRPSWLQQPSRSTSKPVPTHPNRFSSSRATRLTGISKYVRPTAPSGNPSAGRAPLSLSRTPGEWQRKVSHVPRPSATPDRFGRRPGKRQKLGVNPVAPKW